MENLTDIEFDHDAEFIKHREMGKGVTFEQDGVLFSSGYVALKVLKVKPPKDEFDDMTPAELRAALRDSDVVPPKVAKKKVTRKPGSARERAAEKLDGFKAEEQPDYVRQAMSENHAAASAEENAE